MQEFDSSGPLPVPAQLRQQIFRGSDAVAEGLISETRLRRDYRRVLHGVYVPPGTSIDHGVRTLAALLCLPARAVLTAHSSAWWYGVTHAASDAPVMAIVPADTHRGGPRGVTVFRGHVSADEVTVMDGIRVASALRTAWDAAALTDPASALGIVDGLLRRELIGHSQLRQLTDERAGAWGISRVRAVFELADGLSESPAESWTRWQLSRADIEPPILQFEVRDEGGRFVARVDFGWPNRKVALEYDGAYHLDPLQQSRDRHRDAALAELGWTVIHMTASDLREPTRVLHELRRALAR